MRVWQRSGDRKTTHHDADGCVLSATCSILYFPVLSCNAHLVHSPICAVMLVALEEAMALGRCVRMMDFLLVAYEE